MTPADKHTCETRTLWAAIFALMALVTWVDVQLAEARGRLGELPTQQAVLNARIDRLEVRVDTRLDEVESHLVTLSLRPTHIIAPRCDDN